MDLVIKLYSDKPSKLGVRYVYEYLAIREYEALIQKYKGESFTAELEIIKDKVNLTLISDSSGGKVIYKALDFKTDALQRFQALYVQGSPLEFVHVFPKANTLFVAKPFRKPEFLMLSGFSLIGISTGAGY